MNQALYSEDMVCAYCGNQIQSGETSYLLDLPREVIVCSRKCGNEYEKDYYLGKL